MKLITTIISVIFLSLGVQNKFGQIEVFIKDCRNNKLVYNQKIKLKSESGKSYSLITTRKKNKLRKLEPGYYSIEFKSLLGRLEVENIYLSRGERKEIEICLNKFTSDIEPIKQVTIVDSILIDEKYQITYRSRGCFHFIQDSIQILRKENGYYIHKKEEWEKMTNSEIESIRDFELKLFNGKMLGSCTTSDTYGFKYKNHHGIICFDGSCKWKGFKYLKNKIEL